ncbi:membrane protein [hydrothermal vent metagenome]|uniref:Membrane protein n=1 Tax=hydrothermal vent metagenome TaxID=652676 RepID=A0A1W1CU81_9ZZZZ
MPIGTHEASIYYANSSVLYYLTHLCDGLFSNSLEFRLPFLVFGFLNILLFYKMSKHYFENIEDSYLATTVFLLLPGIITATILVNIAVVVITLVLLFLIFYEKKQIVGQILVMIGLVIVHDASIIFFIALAIFSIFQKNKILFGISIFLSIISLLYFNKLEIGGKPTGEFLELFGLYIALFSPLVFFYFFYALYRIWLREQKDILWYISFSAFILSILVSLRQQVHMTDFAPYVIVSVVLMLLTYYKTLYVRLPQFQKNYRIGFMIVFGSLVLSAMVIVFHQAFFYILDDKSKHFAYKFYEPYWQVLELKEIGKNCYTAKNEKIQYQLKYYGIEKCQDSNVPKIHR